VSIRRFWTEAELELLRRNYADSLSQDIATALGRPVGTVHQQAAKLGLKKNRDCVAERARQAMQDPAHGGRAHQLKKGNVPANKGVKHPKGWAPGDMARTQFKPGQMPHTWVPVGSFSINSVGYLDKKLSETPGARHLRWKPVHRLVWEEANGPVPAGHVVVFKPGRKTIDPALITLDAIELVSRAELMARNTLHNMPKELAQLVQLRGVLNRQINRKAKEAETT